MQHTKLSSSDTVHPVPDAAPPLHEQLDALVDAIAAAMQVPGVTLWVFDRQHDRLVVAATRGLPRSGIGFVTLTPGEGISGRAALQRQTLSITDVTLDSSFQVIPGFDQSSYRSLMAAPITRGSTLLGVINVQTEDPHEFTAADEVGLERHAAGIAELLNENQESGTSLDLRGPNLLATLRGMVDASYGPVRVGEEVIGELAAVLPAVQCAVMLVLDDGTHLLERDDGSALGRTLASFAVQQGDAEFETPSILVIPLRGAAGICGYLGISNEGTGDAAWQAPAVRAYVASVAEHLGSAIDRMRRRTRAIEKIAREQQYSPYEQTPYGEFVAYVLDNRGLEAMVGHARDVLATPIAVVDEFGEVLAGVMPELVLTDLPITVSDGQLGRLLAGHSLAAEPILETLAHVVALELSKRRSAFEVESRLRSDVLTMLMSDESIDPALASQRASFAGLSLTDAYRAVSIEFDPAALPGRITPSEAARMLVTMAHRFLGGPPRVVAFVRADGLLLLVHESVADVTERMDGFAAHLARPDRAARIGAVGVGVGRSHVWPDGFAKGIKRTLLSANLARRLGETGPVSVDRLGIYGLLLQLDESSWQEYVTEELGPLIEQDARTGAELVRTLDAYHRNGERLKPTADELFIHANTLKYRLARIETVTKGRFSSPSKRFEIYAALYVLRLLGSDQVSPLG